MSMVSLREISRADLPALNRWRADEESIAELGAPFRHVGRETDDRWLENYLANRANNVRLAICVDGREEPVGVVYLLGIDWVVRDAEFAILVGDRASQHQGIGEIATRRMIGHAFGDLNLRRLHLTVLADNARAIALYRKVGFVEEGRLRQAAFKRGAYVDQLQMALLSDEYRDNTSESR